MLPLPAAATTIGGRRVSIDGRFAMMAGPTVSPYILLMSRTCRLCNAAFAAALLALVLAFGLGGSAGAIPILAKRGGGV